MSASSAAAVFLGLLLLLCPAAPPAIGQEKPIASIYAAVPNDAQNRFFDGMRRFADQNAFAIRIAPTTPDEKHFLIQLWRSDVKMFGTNPYDNIYRLRFYQNGTYPLPSPALDQLVAGINAMLRDVEGITVKTGD